MIISCQILRTGVTKHIPALAHMEFYPNASNSTVYSTARQVFPLAAGKKSIQPVKTFFIPDGFADIALLLPVDNRDFSGIIEDRSIVFELSHRRKND